MSGADRSGSLAVYGVVLCVLKLAPYHTLELWRKPSWARFQSLTGQGL